MALALSNLGLKPWELWRLTFTEFGYLVDHYYNERDFQISQTREILAIIYNMNRSKGPAKEGKDFMSLSNEREVIKSDVPTLEEIEIIKRYGGKASCI